MSPIEEDDEQLRQLKLEEVSWGATDVFFFCGKCPEHVMEMFQMLIHCGDLEHEDLSRN